jgi:asparagine synthase (glutamine-hydrolysing)
MVTADIHLMSGITGIYRTDGGAVEAREVARMSAALAHRGRDGVGQWSDGPVGLAHRLLATTRASAAIEHPVVDASGAVRLVWDGRLDNRDELGADAAESDEAVVLRAYARFGDHLPSRLLGDFAFALWDARCARLFCVRDRLGLKPFHYVWRDGVFRFASELRPLLPALHQVDADDEMVLAFLLREFRPGDEERTFVAGVQRLPPGHVLMVDRYGVHRVAYWAPDPTRTLGNGSDTELAERFRAVFRDAVAARLRTDWPVAALLSGGLDSSAIVGTAARIFDERAEGSPPLDAFTLFSDDHLGDEREAARVVTSATGVKGHVLRRIDADPLDGLDAEVDAVEGPIADPSHHTTAACLDAIAGAGCRVVLSGEGGDQLLDAQGYFADVLRGGHPFRFVRDVRRFAGWYGGDVREVARSAVEMLAPAVVKYWGKRLMRGVPPPWMNQATAQHTRLRRRVRTPRHNVPWPSHAQWETWLSVSSPYYGLKLEAEERRAARAGLEMRYPLLDSRLVELVLAIPSSRRMVRGERKHLLRAAAADVLPPEALARRGKGDWTEPVDRALRRACAAGGLANRSGLLDRYIDSAAAQRLIARYRRGDGDLRWEVWFFITLDRSLERLVRGATR